MQTDNEIVIWDAVLPSVRTARLSLRGERAKYTVNDIGGRFLERNATVRLGWSVQPHVGTPGGGSIGVGGGGGFTFPPVGGTGV